MQIQLKNFGKKYGRKVLYKNQNIVIDIEDAVCLVGESGVGKTTLCNIILGLDKKFSGKCIVSNSNSDIQFAIMPQSNKLLEYATVYENILAFTEEDEIEKIDILLKGLKIFELRDRFVSEISGGQKQRVNLARALINKPDFILLDEPTGNLDDDTTKSLLQALKVCTENGIKFLIITHDNRVTNFFPNILTIENNEIIYSNNTGIVDAKPAKRKKAKLKANTLYKISKKRNKKHFFMNATIVSLGLTCAMLISMFLFSENNQFIKMIRDQYGKNGGIITTTHYLNGDSEDGCDSVLDYKFCDRSMSVIPGYEGFSKEEEEYLKNYPGIDEIIMMPTSQASMTYENTILSSESYKEELNNYIAATGDTSYKSADENGFTMQPKTLPGQPSQLIKMGNSMIEKQFFIPIAGEVHDLAPNEIVIPENYAKVLAYENGVSVDELVGHEYTFDTLNTICIREKDPTCEEEGTISYKIAWVYKESAQDSDYIIYLPPLVDLENQKYDLDYATSSINIFQLNGIDDILNGFLKQKKEEYQSDLDAATSEDQKKIYKDLIEVNSSIENKRKSLQTGDTVIFYALKDGYTQKEFGNYIKQGPDPLSARDLENPYVLLTNKSYNNNYKRIYIVVATVVITSIITLVLQNMYFKVIINELRLARLMGYSKRVVNKILAKHLFRSFATEVIIGSLVSGAVVVLINSYVSPIMININNIIVLGIILIIIGLISFIFHYIIVLKIDVKKELHD